MCLSFETFMSIIRTVQPILVELTDLELSNNLPWMVNFPIWIPNCDSHSPALLDLFISSDASICSIMAFPPLGNSDHNVSVSIGFPLKSKSDVLFYCIAYNYGGDCDTLCDQLADVP